MRLLRPARRLRPLAAAAAALALAVALSDAARAAGPDDPLYLSKGSWGQDYDDQWGLKRIGFGPGADGKTAWDLVAGDLAPVTVAVIDTGLDYFHADFDRRNVWRNPYEKLDGLDTDGNGYVDDVMGWNFVARDNNPYDKAGHGTHTAGVIAAATGNGTGIAGVNPAARIMPLKVLNFIGRGRSSGIAEAIFYATERGARVINLSLGGEELTSVERKAVAYAAGKGVVVVAASGNTSRETSGYGYAGLDSVIVVGASDLEDKRAGFSNWGPHVKVVAPGMEILSLKARRTDFLLVSGAKDYVPDGAVVGTSNAYYRASGTSFAAPFVSGVASLLFSMNPDLTAAQVTRMIVQSARDIETPGFDQFTGYGLLDARAAVVADPEFFVEARIAGAAAAKGEGGVVLEVTGTADADSLARAWIEAAPGESASEGWKKVSGEITSSVTNAPLARIAPQHFQGAKVWTLRLVVEHANGRTREARFVLRLG